MKKEYDQFIEEQRNIDIENRIQDEYHIQVEIGLYCRHFRETVLKLTRVELAPSVKPQTLAQFESGNSSNINHFVKYFNACEGTHQQLEFIKGLMVILKEGNLID